MKAEVNEFDNYSEIRLLPEDQKDLRMLMRLAANGNFKRSSMRLWVSKENAEMEINIPYYNKGASAIVLKCDEAKK